MRLKHIILILGVLLIPIILNFTLSLTTPFSLPVIGDPETWLSFFGSFLGGVFTILIGVISIRKESRHNALMIKAQNQRNMFLLLRQEFSKIIDALDYSQIARFALYENSIVDKKMIEEELLYVNQLSSNCTSKANSWGFISICNNKDIPEFSKLYKTSLENYRSDINAMTHILNDANARINESSKKKFSEVVDVKKLNGLMKRIQEHIKIREKLYSEARSILSNNRNEEDTLYDLMGIGTKE